MTPFYEHLKGFPGQPVASAFSNLDRVGLFATIGVGAAFAAHGLIGMLRRSGAAPPPPAPPSAREEAEKKGDRP